MFTFEQWAAEPASPSSSFPGLHKEPRVETLLHYVLSKLFFNDAVRA